MSKVALVTGGTRGIGRAISERLARDGYRVAANYAGNDEAAAKCASDLGVKAYKWDVGDYDACASGIAQVTQDLGPIDVLVNNAGITRDATLHRMTREQWDDVIRVDLTSAFNLCRLTIEGIQKRVADHYQIRHSDMTSKRRPNAIAFPRQIAMYLSRQLTRNSLQQIGEAFGGRDHGTVIHAIKTVENMMETDDSVRGSVDFLKAQLSK